MLLVLPFRNSELTYWKTINFSLVDTKTQSSIPLIPVSDVVVVVGTGKRIEREEEEEEEALPLDMMDEDDLQLMRDLGQRASFLTRDLSSR